MSLEAAVLAKQLRPWVSARSTSSLLIIKGDFALALDVTAWLRMPPAGERLTNQRFLVALMPYLHSRIIRFCATSKAIAASFSSSSPALPSTSLRWIHQSFALTEHQVRRCHLRCAHTIRKYMWCAFINCCWWPWQPLAIDKAALSIFGVVMAGFQSLPAASRYGEEINKLIVRRLLPRHLFAGDAGFSFSTGNQFTDGGLALLLTNCT